MNRQVTIRWHFDKVLVFGEPNILLWAFERKKGIGIKRAEARAKEALGLPKETMFFHDGELPTRQAGYKVLKPARRH